jgi:hypothetical protein
LHPLFEDVIAWRVFALPISHESRLAALALAAFVAMTSSNALAKTPPRVAAPALAAVPQVTAGPIADTLIEGVWNNGKERYAEYYPEKFLAFAPALARQEYVQEASNGRSKADAYLRFIVGNSSQPSTSVFQPWPGQNPPSLWAPAWVV